jgi:hypothetical protein
LIFFSHRLMVDMFAKVDSIRLGQQGPML